MHSKLTRRRFLAGASIALTAGAHLPALTQIGPKTKTLRLCTWEDFISPQILGGFEAATGCQVKVTVFSSNEELQANLAAKMDAFDVVTPSSYVLRTLWGAGLISAIERDLVPNLQFLSEPLFQHFSDTLCAVPFATSTSGVAYVENHHKPRNPSWSAFDEPDIAGRYTLLNDMRDLLGAALRYVGKSVNSKNASDIESAKNVAKIWSRNARRLQSQNYKRDLIAGTDKLVHGYDGDFIHTSDQSKTTSFIVPEEGAPSSTDHLCICSQSPEKELAHQFINFMPSPNKAAENMQWSGFRSSSPDARVLLPGILRDSPVLFPPPHLEEKCEQLQDVGDALSLYEQAWSEIING